MATAQQLADQVERDIEALVVKHRPSEDENRTSDEKFQDWLAAMDPSQETPKKRHRGMTWDKFYKRILMGYGMGHGAEYLPWLTLRRKNPSRKSNQVAAYLHPLNRDGYFFSRGEYQIALLLLWLGVLDLREQYPLWPVAHPHPLFGAPGTEELQLGYCSGLLEIAATAGIDHGRFPGTNIPYVATIDFLITVQSYQGLELIGFSCKPIENSENTIKWRTLERLELERRYAERSGFRYYVISSRVVPILMAGQLEWCIERCSLSDVPNLVDCIEPFSREFESTPDLSISEAVGRASQINDLSIEDGWTLFRHCAWTQAIDINLSEPILTSYPARQGGRALRENLQRSLIGGVTK